MSTLTETRAIPTSPAMPTQAQEPVPSGGRPTLDDITEPRRHRWTTDEYMGLIDTGLFVDKRTELIDGEILDVLSQKNPHAAAISNVARLLFSAFDKSFWVTVQSTTRLPSGDVPEPDFALRPGPATADDSYHPLPLLVIEVSDTALLFDQFVKSSVYAANGIRDYWIVNVKDHQVEVYRDPVPDPTRRHGHRYSSVNTFKPGTSISPLAGPQARFEVDRMLP